MESPVDAHAAARRNRSNQASAGPVDSTATDRTILSDTERLARDLQRVFAQVPAGVCVMRGRSHVIESANTLYRQLVGHRDLIGKPVRDAFPELPETFFALLDRAYHTGDPYVGTEVRAVWDRGSGTPEEGFTNFVYQPLRDSEDVVYGIMAHVVDVTELVRARRLAEEQPGVDRSVL